MGEPNKIADWLVDLPSPPWPTFDASPEAEARRAADIARAAVEDERRRRRDVLERVTKTVPRSYRWAFDRPMHEAVTPRVGLEGWRDQLEAWAGSRWVILAGPAGSGKTSLAVAMLRAAVDAACDSAQDSYDTDRAGRYAFVHAYRMGIARIQHRAGDGEAPDVRDAMLAPLALIDDLGAERDTANNAAPDVLFERHAEGRDTWITTGLTVPQLKARYGDGVTRRLLEQAKIIKLGGAT